MVGFEDPEAADDDVGDGCADAGVIDELVIVTVNVDGLGSFGVAPSARMDGILDEVLATSPDVVM